MFIVNLTYKVEMSEVEKHMAAHIKYLDRQYEQKHFLASGRKVPRTGGVIMSNVDRREVLEAILSEDPFMVNAVADFDVIEFTPTKTSAELEFLRRE